MVAAIDCVILVELNVVAGSVDWIESGVVVNSTLYVATAVIVSVSAAEIVVGSVVLVVLFVVVVVGSVTWFLVSVCFS